MAKVVLIVDDDPCSMKLSFDLLSVFGYAAITASNGREAVEKARSENPALILMDIQLPVLDGLAATKMIKAEISTRRIPIIATTAYAMKGDEEKVIAAGCDGYITKPINIHQLLETVEKYLGARSSEKILENRRAQ